MYVHYWSITTHDCIYLLCPACLHIRGSKGGCMSCMLHIKEVGSLSMSTLLLSRYLQNYRCTGKWTHEHMRMHSDEQDWQHLLTRVAQCKFVRCCYKTSTTYILHSSTQALPASASHACSAALHPYKRENVQKMQQLLRLFCHKYLLIFIMCFLI